MTHPPTVNPLDPLSPSKPIAPDPTRKLFKQLSQVCRGFSGDDVVWAAANLMINAIRQRCANRVSAERAIDEAFGLAKHALLERHYDGQGNRRNIFPYDQVVEPAHFKASRN